MPRYQASNTVVEGVEVYTIVDTLTGKSGEQWYYEPHRNAALRELNRRQPNTIAAGIYLLKKLPKGEFVRLKAGSAKVYVRGDYDRTTRTFELTDTNDINHVVYRKVHARSKQDLRSETPNTLEILCTPIPAPLPTTAASRSSQAIEPAIGRS